MYIYLQVVSRFVNKSGISGVYGSAERLYEIGLEYEYSQLGIQPGEIGLAWQCIRLLIRRIKKMFFNAYKLEIV
ncbi:hypothetical protein EUGRSUZ_H00562 [Eucalyptus grandis]|uniref:Uncharacterized protein n=2 Tax=Eucalyptus grandis TaxID=71139 RepID=A0ACC3JM47_EUCGR|nr:hypothetical protein EUGRSUZ_H00562 [Eucalyptus grandis]